jgi:hypothetical protein
MPSPRTGAADVVRREEKFSTLAAFLSEELPGALEATQGASLNIDLIARSPDSPVVQALTVALAEVPDDRIEIRAIFAMDAEAAGLEKISPQSEVRTTPSGNLDDAHEQLSIGDEIAWIGDSMRRDPAKLDAYERFISGDLEPCGWTNHAFRQLWNLAIAPKRGSFHAVFDVTPSDAIGPALTALRDGTTKTKWTVN